MLKRWSFIIAVSLILISLTFSPVSLGQDDSTPTPEIDVTSYSLQTEIVQESVYDIAVDPDGVYLAVATQVGVQFFSLPSLEFSNFFLEHIFYQPYEITWSPDGTRLALIGEDFEAIQIWSVNERQLLVELENPSSQEGSLIDIAWSPDAKYLAAGGGYIWDANTGRLLRQIGSGVRQYFPIAWSPDSTRLATARNRSVEIWSVQTGEKLKDVTLSSLNLNAVDWSLNGIVVATSDGIYTLDDNLGVVYSNNEGSRYALWSPDGTKLASLGLPVEERRRVITIWDMDSGDMLQQLEGHIEFTNGIQWANDSIMLLSYSRGDTIKVWNVINGQSQQIDRFSGFLTKVAVSPSGEYIAAATSGQIVFVWDAFDGDEEMQTRGNIIAWSPSGTKLAAVDTDFAIRILSMAEGDEIVALNGHTDSVLDLQWSPDGNYLASASMDFTVRWWDTQTGEEIYMIGQHGDPHTQVNHIAWSPDGTKLAVTTADFGINILDASDGRLISQVANSSYGACCSINVVWSSDGTQLASRDLVNLSDYSPIEIDVWRVEPVEKLRTIEEFDESSWFDMFLWSVDGRYFIIPSGNVQFVDSLTGEIFHTLGESSSGFTELSQSQDGRILASMNDWSISVWVLPQ